MPTTQIACLGISHNTAPVSMRENVRCAMPQRDEPLLANAPAALREVVVLSTCNRIEVYGVIEASEDPRETLMAYLAAQHDTYVDAALFAPHLYFHEGLAAVDHLARVAAGLDSMVLGEPQILGQVTTAYMQALARRGAGPVLNALFRMAIRVGKRARSETAISSNPASISSVAINLAQELLGDLAHRQALVVGLGEMGELALKALHKRGATGIAVANRTRARAEQLAHDWGGVAYDLTALPEALAKAEVVICATAAPTPVITEEVVAEATREGRELVLIDIAVPRDVEPAVADVPGVHLFNVDDLRDVLEASMAARRQEVPKVEAIIDGEVACIELELRRLEVQPLIAELRQQAEAIRQRELARTLRFLGDDVDDETLKHIHHLSRSLVNKLLHEPTLFLREQATSGEAADYETAVRDLFALKG